MPSDSTLLTALGRLMSLYDARSAEVFFHFLWGICNDMTVPLFWCTSLFLLVWTVCWTLSIIVWRSCFCQPSSASYKCAQEWLNFTISQPTAVSSSLQTEFEHGTVCCYIKHLFYICSVHLCICMYTALQYSLYFVDLSLCCHFIRNRDMGACCCESLVIFLCFFPFKIFWFL